MDAGIQLQGCIRVRHPWLLDFGNPCRNDVVFYIRILIPLRGMFMPIISMVIFFLTSLFLLITTLLGGGINIPIFELKSKQSGHLVLLPEQKHAIWELFQLYADWVK
jgi:hypothetical protein